MRSARPAIAMLTGLVLASCMSASASPSVRSSTEPSASQASAEAVASARAQPSATAAASVAETPEPTPVAGQLPVPGFVTVVADAVTVRQAPGLDAEPVIDRSTCIDNPNPCERPFTMGTARGYLWGYLFDGPVSADGYAWYQIATEMNTEHHASTHPEAVGWVAAGDAEDAWLVPDGRACPTEPVELAAVTNLAITKLEMLHCFGDRELTLEGWLPPFDLGDGEQDPAVSMAECRERMAWLVCGSIYDIIRTKQIGWAGNADYLDFVVNPASDLVVPDRGRMVTVTGSFDHPDAADCGDTYAILVCRFSFVLTSIEPADS